MVDKKIHWKSFSRRAFYPECRFQQSGRGHPPDREQPNNQPIRYCLLNYKFPVRRQIAFEGQYEGD
jgi:hypothetical protein